MKRRAKRQQASELKNKNEWMNWSKEWMKEWMNEWIIKWMSEWAVWMKDKIINLLSQLFCAFWASICKF